MQLLQKSTLLSFWWILIHFAVLHHPLCVTAAPGSLIHTAHAPDSGDELEIGRASTSLIWFICGYGHILLTYPHIFNSPAPCVSTVAAAASFARWGPYGSITRRRHHHDDEALCSAIRVFLLRTSALPRHISYVSIPSSDIRALLIGWWQSGQCLLIRQRDDEDVLSEP
ncbi:hypothetical protein M422DRAFT_263082 [Sphaerobolus stellatus SS14]|uniref:Secreted protein n=1 Tax=Sphaerobolus stellatus (strain SS14) TaxID=990650 RepID=A0A0C9UIM6_SPHS4|nr:hypothetical protein M422DRAFT_263082 [Sphaerobolus stellatus SS14]